MSIVCIITTGLLFLQDTRNPRHHTNQIRALQVPEQVAQNGDMANAPRLRKTALATFYMYMLFLIFHIYSLFKKYINSCIAKLRRQRRRTVKNNNRSRLQKGNFARAAHFYCTFACRCFARLQREIFTNFLVTHFMEAMSYVFSLTFFFHCRSFSPCIGGRQHFLFSHRSYKNVMLFL